MNERELHESRASPGRRHFGKKTFEVATKVAVSIAKEKGSVTLADVQEEILLRYGVSIHGPSINNLFRTSMWEDTGKVVESRSHKNQRKIRVWKLTTPKDQET